MNAPPPKKRKGIKDNIRQSKIVGLVADGFRVIGWLLKRLPQLIRRSYLALMLAIAALAFIGFIALVVIPSDAFEDLFGDYEYTYSTERMLDNGTVEAIRNMTLAGGIILVGLPILIGLAYRLYDFYDYRRIYRRVRREGRQDDD